VKEFGPYPINVSAVYNESAALEFNKIYCFEVVDLWGDGIGTFSLRAYYKVRKDDPDKTMIIQNYDIKTFGDKFFFRTTTQSPMGIESLVEQSRTIVFVKSDTKTAEVSFAATTTGSAYIAIYSITGKLLLNQSVATASGEISKTSVSVSSFPAGVYLLNITQKDKKETFKLIIN
jgi:hypothetical protein